MEHGKKCPIDYFQSEFISTDFALLQNSFDLNERLRDSLTTFKLKWQTNHSWLGESRIMWA